MVRIDEKCEIAGDTTILDVNQRDKRRNGEIKGDTMILDVKWRD